MFGSFKTDLGEIFNDPLKFFSLAKCNLRCPVACIFGHFTMMSLKEENKLNFNRWVVRQANANYIFPILVYLF